MPAQLPEFTFYGFCILQGLVGWAAFGMAMYDEADPMMQGAYTVPLVAPIRRLLMSAMGWSLMFACALAWIAPWWTVALTWAGFVFAAANLFVPAFLERGIKGPLLLERVAWVSLAIRASIAIFMTWQAPHMIENALRL